VDFEIEIKLCGCRQFVIHFIKIIVRKFILQVAEGTQAFMFESSYQLALTKVIFLQFCKSIKKDVMTICFFVSQAETIFVKDVMTICFLCQRLKQSLSKMS